ncbi:hypothetical protein PGB90_000894 [Kerria lacca]
MSRILKRKRRSSDSYTSDEDKSPYQKKIKHKTLEESSEDPDIPEVTTCNREEPSSKLFLPNLPEHDVCNDCFCNNCCTALQTEEQFSHTYSSTSETDHDLQPLQSELSESKEYSDLILSSNSNDDYSSSDERIIGSEIISSPVAGSVIDSDFEKEFYTDHRNNSENEEPSKVPSKVLSFMGQLTPSSSVNKFQFRNLECSTWTSFRNCSTGASELYASDYVCPIPQLSWTCRKQFWCGMCNRDEESAKRRNPELFLYQLYLRPRMRVILLDWISEVAELFKLHRETYYLSLDYVDRYLSRVDNVPKTQLQLIGITCLTIAAKMEEIYPPKIAQFAEVTDGACTEEDIFNMEIAIVTHLDWQLSPITINNWLEMMLQFIYQNLEKTNKNLFTPHFSSSLYKRLCQLLDLVTLDITSLRFSYGVLVASAIYILVDPNLAISTSGLKKEILEPCVQWMSVYWSVLRDTYSPEMADVSDLLTDKSEIYFGDQHPELQTHSVSMQLYDLTQEQFELLAMQKEINLKNSQILTPPPSSSKSVNNVDEEDTSN